MSIKLPARGAKSLKAGINTKSRERRAQLIGATKLRALPVDWGRNDVEPELLLEHRAIADLRLAARRLRKSNAEHVREVARSISAFGFCAPILIDGLGKIIDGSIRWEAAKHLAMDTIPCIVIDHLSEEQVRLLSITLNRMAEKGEWDTDQLHLELVDLSNLELDLQLTGFSDIELGVLMQEPVLRESADNEEPEPEEVAVSVLGDLWHLGNHKLICGDATKRETYERLLGEERAHMSFGDPPYNLKIKGFVSGLGKKKHEDFAVSGELSDEEFREFLASYLTRCREFTHSGAVIFACMDFRCSHILSLAARDAKLNPIQMCVWDKGSGSMGSLYRNAFELVHVLCTAPKPAVNNIELGRHGRDRTNVQTYPGANRRGSSAAEALKLHATPKPVELVEDYMLDVSGRGDIVLDPFMGSGTTIIAAERCGRRARGIELEPRFVDAAIRRWQERTGNSAVHIETGLTFSETAGERAAE